MGKKLSDELCRENYNRLRALFDSAVADHDRFEMAHAVGMDAGMMNYVVVRVTTYTYFNYAVGFDRAANEIVILPVDVEMSKFGQPCYLKKEDVKKAKQSFISKEITIHSPLLPKKYIQFSVVEQMNEDEDNVVILTKQDEEAKQFQDFFKNRFSSK